MNKVSKAVFYITVLFFFINCSQDKVSLRQGDLLFQASESSRLANAIEGAGRGYNGYAFSHVGIVNIENGDTTVIEAIPKYGVRIVSLQTFLTQSKKDKNGKPLVCIGRLLPKYETVIEQSINRAKILVGKAYDSVFLPNNDAYYCSELVYDCFLDSNQAPIFANYPMSFKDKETNEFYPAWVDFFDRIGMPIPEGTAGTNPNDMSNSDIIKIIYSFF